MNRNPSSSTQKCKKRATMLRDEAKIPKLSSFFISLNVHVQNNDYHEQANSTEAAGWHS